MTLDHALTNTQSLFLIIAADIVFTIPLDSLRRAYLKARAECSSTEPGPDQEPAEQPLCVTSTPINAPDLHIARQVGTITTKIETSARMTATPHPYGDATPVITPAAMVGEGTRLCAVETLSGLMNELTEALPDWIAWCEEVHQAFEDMTSGAERARPDSAAAVARLWDLAMEETWMGEALDHVTDGLDAAA